MTIDPGSYQRKAYRSIWQALADLGKVNIADIFQLAKTVYAGLLRSMRIWAQPPVRQPARDQRFRRSARTRSWHFAKSTAPRLRLTQRGDLRCVIVIWTSQTRLECSGFVFALGYSAAVSAWRDKSAGTRLRRSRSARLMRSTPSMISASAQPMPKAYQAALGEGLDQFSAQRPIEARSSPLKKHEQARNHREAKPKIQVDKRPRM